MTNIKKVAARMAKEHCTLSELGITLKEVREMKENGYNILAQQQPGKGRVYYISDQREAGFVFQSGKSKKTTIHRWVELSDTHFGCKAFDEIGLRDCLARGIDYGFTDCHISGDLCDGNKVYSGQQNELKYFTSEEQAQGLAEILMDYDYNYYAIEGNHDESFEKHGSPNPVKLVEGFMTQEGRRFTYLGGMVGDIIISGIVKRMVHLAGKGAYAKSYPGQVYLRNLFDSHGEDVWCRGNKYRMRFGQFGHFHSNITYESNGVYCTHPGNFQFPNSFTQRLGLVGDQGCRLTTAMIEDGKVIEYTSSFIKPRHKHR